MNQMKIGSLKVTSSYYRYMDVDWSAQCDICPMTSESSIASASVGDIWHMIDLYITLIEIIMNIYIINANTACRCVFSS